VNEIGHAEKLLGGRTYEQIDMYYQLGFISQGNTTKTIRVV